ncbi:MAG: hypothetical protein NDI60_08095 [Elusimicrobiales bacterium]|nr:hypothetical protein [Elusimicrobiales bacterium]
MEKKTRIVGLGVSFPERHRLMLEKQGCEVLQYPDAGSFEEALREAQSAEAVCFSTLWQQHLPQDFLPRLKKCRILAVPAGASVDPEEAASYGISVATCQRYSVPALAEYAFSLLLSLARKIACSPSLHPGPALAAQARAMALGRGVELRGKTLGLVRYGSFGPRIARLGSALGMNVLAPKWKAPRLFSRFFRHRFTSFVDLDSLLASSDMILSILPPRGRIVFDMDAFTQMKPGCLFVRVGHWGVDESALQRALQKGMIAGAALEVPLGVEQGPLAGLPNVQLYPTLPFWASNTEESELRFGGECANNLAAFLAGKPTDLSVKAARPGKE